MKAPVGFVEVWWLKSPQEFALTQLDGINQDPRVCLNANQPEPSLSRDKGSEIELEVRNTIARQDQLMSGSSEPRGEQYLKLAGLQRVRLIAQAHSEIRKGYSL